MKVYFILFLLIISLNTNITNAGSEVHQPTFVFVGDSNTASVQWENGSYVVKLADLGEPWTSLNLTNSGNDGWGFYSYYEHPELINSQILQYKPDFILIAMGGNDFLRFYSSEDFETFYRYLVSKLLDVYDECSITQIYLANIYWGNIDLPSASINRYNEYQATISKIGDENDFPVIDFFTTTENHTEYYPNDPIHLNEEGHIAIAKTINQTIGADVKTKLDNIPDHTSICELDVPTSASVSDTTSKSNQDDSSYPPLLVSSMLIIVIIQLRKRS